VVKNAFFQRRLSQHQIFTGKRQPAMRLGHTGPCLFFDLVHPKVVIIGDHLIDFLRGVDDHVKPDQRMGQVKDIADAVDEPARRVLHNRQIDVAPLMDPACGERAEQNHPLRLILPHKNLRDSLQFLLELGLSIHVNSSHGLLLALRSLTSDF
jgi:hypothetical protein